MNPTTVIIEADKREYSGDRPDAVPPAGWQRVPADQVPEDFIYTPFVWLDSKGQLIDVQLQGTSQGCESR